MPDFCSKLEQIFELNQIMELCHWLMLLLMHLDIRKKGALDVAKLLISHGAKKEDKNSKGRSL